MRWWSNSIADGGSRQDFGGDRVGGSCGVEVVVSGFPGWWLYANGGLGQEGEDHRWVGCEGEDRAGEPGQIQGAGIGFWGRNCCGGLDSACLGVEFVTEDCPGAWPRDDRRWIVNWVEVVGRVWSLLVAPAQCEQRYGASGGRRGVCRAGIYFTLG